MTVVQPEKEEKEVEKESVKDENKPVTLRRPIYREDMLNQAKAAVNLAKKDGITRMIVRMYLPKGPENRLFPDDESWEGGIMQLYGKCAPLTKDLMKKISADIAGIPPSMKE